MAGIAKGTKVWVSLDGEKDLIGFVVSNPYEQKAESGDETKYKIQVGAEVHPAIGYREPEDRDASGKGQTFWLV